MTSVAVRAPLREGERGPDVAALQAWLNKTFPSYSRIDLGPQRYGPQTIAVIAEFQRREGVTGPDADGRIVGPRTWVALERHGYGRSPVPDAVRPASAVSDWPSISPDERMRYVVKRLVERYGYPVNGAAGIVGNLWSESAVLPSRIEGSKAGSPLRAQDFHGKPISFTTEQVMKRDKKTKLGPRLAGVGLAQWTFESRRAGLFTHLYEGKSLGPDVLFDMDAQIDYLNLELRSIKDFADVLRVVLAPSVAVHAASDEVVYSFERPGAILRDNRRLPRTSPEVQAVFRARRQHSDTALKAYLG
jgi:Phage tail lysozyme/Putative peptidoglycan binding domain